MLSPPNLTEFVLSHSLSATYKHIWEAITHFMSSDILFAVRADQIKLSLLLNILAGFSLVHTIYSLAKVNLAFWFFLLMRGFMA